MEVLNTKLYSVKKEWLDERVPSEAKKLGLRHFINEVFKRLEGIENFDMESWCQEHSGDWEIEIGGFVLFSCKLLFEHLE